MEVSLNLRNLLFLNCLTEKNYFNYKINILSYILFFTKYKMTIMFIKD
jgi:hypothetical protein